VIWLTAPPLLAASTGDDRARGRTNRSAPTNDTRILIILQAGAETHEGRARALHALLYAKELRAAGATVRLTFDGAGTEWLARVRDAALQDGRLAVLFRELTDAGVTYEVCDYCSGAFEVRDQLLEAGELLTGAYMDHPSVAAHVADGFAVWIL
jgi:DsrE/DsrF-like family